MNARDTETVLKMVRKMVTGYQAGMHTSESTDDGMRVDVEFPTVYQAAVCADTLTKVDRWEHIAPRMALEADLAGPHEALSITIHVPVTLRFKLNPKWVEMVLRDRSE